MALALLAVAVLPLLMLGAASSSIGHTPTAAPNSSIHGSLGLLPAVTYPSPIRHVFVLFLENAELSGVKSNGAYEMSLAKNYTQATHYYAPCHPSAPEYLAATSGSTWQCGSDSVSAGGYSTNNIGNLSQQAGLSWAGYMESMPSPCDSSDSYPYAARHNPFVYYSDIAGTVCKAHVANFTAWDANVSAGTIPSFAFFAPNLKNDGHDTSVGYADKWLKGWLPQYLNASWFNSSVWFVTYDEGSSNSGYGSFYGGQLYFTAVSPYTAGGHTFSNYTTHYNLLSTVEWLLGLGGTGNNDSTSSYPAMKSLFNFTLGKPQPLYPLTGTVSSSATALGVPGATVSVAGGPTATTNGSGDYTFSLSNGTYSVTASAAGLVATTTSITINGTGAYLNFSLVKSNTTTPTYSISGWVESKYDNSLRSGATVQVVGGPSVQTGSNGTYYFREPNGTYQLTAWSPGFQMASQSVTVAGAGVTANFLLPRFYWELVGAVSDSGTGRYLVGANVSVTAGPLSFLDYSITNSSGGYGVSLPNATFTLTVTDTGYRSTTASVTVTGSHAPLDFTLVSLVSPTASRYPLQGAVTYATNGSAASGISVVIHPGYSARTDGSGQFVVQVVNGSYTVSARDPGWKSTSQATTISGAGASVAITLDRQKFHVGGLVRSQDGTAGANLTVAVPSLSLTTTTSANGSYTMSVPNGTYVLHVSGARIVPSDVSFTVAGGPVVLNVSVQAAPLSIPPSSGGGAWTGLLLGLLFNPVVVVGLGIAAVGWGAIAHELRLERRLRQLRNSGRAYRATH